MSDRLCLSFFSFWQLLTHLCPLYSAGVSGLTTALLLARDKANTVTVLARHMPGDYDPEYTSPWAGANVLP